MRLKILAAGFAATTALTPTPARADPVSVSLFIQGVLAGIAGTAPMALTIGTTAFTAGVATAAFITGIGGTIISAALSYGINAIMAQRNRPKPQAVHSNVKAPQSPRFLAAGRLRIGGTFVFGETPERHIYKLIAHCDSEMTAHQYYMLDNIVAETDADGWVTSPEFTVGALLMYRLQSRPGTATQAALPDLVTTFNEWTASHVGAGVADTLLTLKPVGQKYIPKLRSFRGTMGLGEPDVSRVADWGRAYDPRDATQDVNNPATWGSNKRNPALIFAWHRMHAERFAMHAADINWQNIAEQADYCDEIVVNRYGENVKRYRCDVLINKQSDSNIAVEDRILASCDGMRFEDESGRIGLHVGKYIEPVVTLTQEDIFVIKSDDGRDGETNYSHTSIQYTEPVFAFAEQDSAPFIAEDWDPTTTVKKETISIFEIPDHNQAVRISAVHSRRQRALQLVVVAGLRGRLLKEHRFVRIDIGTDFLSGVYEIATKTTLDDGMRVGLGLVKVDSGWWDLQPGQEGERPNFNIDVTVSDTLTNVAPSDMNIFAASTALSGGIFGSSFGATFVVPSRPDRIVEIEYRQTGTSVWYPWTVRTEDGNASTPAVNNGVDYDHRWRVSALSGKTTSWSSIVVVRAVADQTAPGAVTGVSISSPSAGTVDLSWTDSPEANYMASEIRRNTVSNISTATLVATEYGLPGAADTWQDTGLAADTYYYWITPLNGSSIAGPVSGPHSQVVA